MPRLPDDWIWDSWIADDGETYLRDRRPDPVELGDGALVRRA